MTNEKRRAAEQGSLDRSGACRAKEIVRQKGSVNMVVILKQNFTLEQMEEAVRSMEAGGVKVMVSRGSETTILGAEGDASRLDEEFLSQLPGVERVMRVSEPFKKANRKFHPDDSVIEIGPGVRVGGQKLAVIAGPCSVESQEQITGVARDVKTAGPPPSGAGPTSPAPRPTPFRAWAPRASTS